VKRLAVALALVAGCGRKEAPPERPAHDETIRPVYAAGPRDPLAERLCRALHGLPEERRAACCNAQIGITLVDECARVLSAALAAGAVRLGAGEVDACATAMASALDGCDWVGAFPSPLPAACRGLARGALASGAVCRSSLECAGGLRCRGAGPTATGRCAPALGEGAACGLAVDALAPFVRDDAVDAEHPECAGFCDHHRCRSSLAANAACAVSAQCGRGRRCGGGACIAGERGAVGEPCSGGDCDDGLRCHRGRCIAPGADGVACASDFECRGGCVGGRCGKRCGVR